MPFLVVIVILLSGCSVTAEAKLIDTYIADSAAGTQSKVLTGRALIAQQQALALVAELGWSQSGAARYSDLRVIGGETVVFCLDVSNVGFVDATGNPVELSRPIERLLMRAELKSLGQQMMIENLEEAGSC